MKKHLLLFCLFISVLFGTRSVNAQTYNMQNTTVTNCSGTLYDSQGSGLPYLNNENYTFTIAPAGATAVTIIFSSFSTEAGYDYMTIYNGPNTSSPVLWGPGAGTTSPGTITANSGVLTIRFTSDGFVTSTGWASTWSCVACTTPGTPTALSGSGSGLTTANLSWAAGTPAGSATVNYNWYVGTNPAGVCGTATQTFNYSGSTVNWTVPAGVSSIDIDAYGAQGGNNSWGQSGGLGARAKGTFAVTPGQVLKILVGGQGGAGDCGGGGGGSFVTTSSNTPMCIAGGGGGVYYAYNSTGSGNMAGTTSSTGQNGYYYNGFTNAGPGGSSGNGGSGSWNVCNGGSGGGGLTGWGGSACDGCPNDGITTFGCSTSSGGSPFTSGGSGGWQAGWAGSGGFGGGGGGSSEGDYGGGGGGGYSGGGGGEGQGCGGGGGSYNTGTTPINTAGVRSGNGIITITYRNYTGAVASGTTTGTTASATGLSCGTNYYLTVYASTSCNGAVSACATSAVFSTYSCCVTPGTPTGPAGSATGPTTANVSWTAGTPAGSATVSYNWYVSTTPAGVCGTTSVPFSYTGAIQNWTVPAGVTSITVEGSGAQGGNDACGTVGGLGARMRGTFNVTPGQTIQVLVGQQGVNCTNACNRGGGGGGGSFVYNLSSATLMLAAGGGGGAGQSGYGTSATSNAVTSTSGVAGSGSGAGAAGTGGTGGGASTYCGGGAGWSSNGTSSGYGQGGFSFTNGGTGGAKYSDGGNGGFGGGGGSYAGSGGGGGYSGGGAGGWSMSGWGGGGGSYNGGTNPTNTAGIQSGNGAVTISYTTIGSSVASGNTTSTSAAVTGLTCNTNYYLTVYALTNYCTSVSACATSSAFLSGACCTPPSISVHPVSQTKCVGTSVTFSVTAAGTGITYQWRKGGTNIGGATSSSYTIPSVVVGDGANYDVVITGTCGTVTSTAASLTVDATSVMGTVSNSGPIDFCNAAGDWTAAGPISVSGHTGTVNWQYGSSNGTWNNWVSGISPAYATFPSKVAASDAQADRIRWSVTNGVCAATGYSSAILLRNHYTAAPSSLTANANITCLGNTATLTATFASSISILGTVEFSTTCGGAPFATVTPGNNVTAVTATVVPVSGPNLYYARYNPGTGTGCTPSTCASVNVIANLAPTLPANNTSGQTICSNSTASLSGNNPAIGTGIWSIVSGPSTSSAQIADVYDNTTVFTPTGGAGNYVIRWTIDNLPCSSELDDATVVVVAAPTPANAGSNQTMCATGTLVLAANNPSVGTGAWNLLSGNGNNSQFNNVAQYNTVFTPSSTAGGTYILEWTTTSSAPCASTTSTMSIASNPTPSTSNAGSNQTICSNSTITLGANNPAIGVGAWSVTSGPSTLSTQFSNTALRTAVFTPAGGAGNYVLTWTISNAPCAASASSLTITVVGAPTTSNAGSAQSICVSSTATLAANNPTVGTGVWTIIGSSPSTNISQLNNATAYNAIFTPSGGAGAYTFRWTITSSAPCVTSSSNVIVTVNSASVLGSVSNAGPINFCSATGDWTAAGPISISGHNGTITWDIGSSDGSWTLGWDNGTQPLYTGIPKKVSASDANYDRIRWSVLSAGCAATGYSATILLRNHYNEAPSTLVSNPPSACATAPVSATLTAVFPTTTNILGTVEFSTSCGGTPFATAAGNGTNSVSVTYTTPVTSTTYFARYIPGTGTSCSPSACANTLVQVDVAPVLGAVSNTGPIDFCSATGDWSTDPILIAGETGIIWWQYGSSNGTWSGDWQTGLSPTYFTFPKKVAVSDANPDRVRWYVKSTNNGCAPTAYSSSILLRNRYNENPTSMSSSINNICSGTPGTLTVTFPTATNILGTVEFATSCGGAAFATVSGNGTTSISTSFTAPASTTTYFARYNPGAGSGCGPGSCASTTVIVLPPAPATPGVITGVVAQCPSVAGLIYSIAAVTNATSYAWTVPTGWSITSGAGTTAITVTSGVFGQNGNISVTASSSCGTSAASVIAVNTNGCLPQPSVMVFPTNANVYVTISSAAVLTVGNPSPNAIVNGGSSGGFNRWIVSEGQNNRLQWSDITPGTYVVPFGYQNTDYIPFTFTKTSAGSSSLVVSTWGTGNTNTPWATATNNAAVTNMWSSTINQDGSIPSVIDRWWNITTTATANLTFSFRDDECATTSSPTGIFRAQHWNGTTWDAPVGSGNGVSSGVGTVSVAGASDFSPWILSSTDAPLPVQWLDASAECNQKVVTVKWSTATEQNSYYFNVERSTDGTNYSSIATILASGNSSTVKNYSALDTDPLNGTSFYRIRETDFNGSYFFSDVIMVNECSGDDISIFGNGYGVSINIHADNDGMYSFEIYDVLGQKLMYEKKNVTAGANHFRLYPGQPSSAIYIVKVSNENNSVTKKVFIRKQP